LAALDFRLVLDALPDAVVAADVAHRIVYANTGLTRLLGWPSEELVGQPLTTIIPARLQPEHREGFKRFIATRQPRLAGKTLRVPALARNAEEVLVELSVSCIPGAGQDGEDLIVGTLRDSRDRIALERQRDLARCLQATADAAARLGTRNDPVQWLHSVCRALVDSFDAALARLWTTDASSGRLVLRSAAGPAMPPEDLEAGQRSMDLAWSPAKIDELVRRRVPFIQSGLEGDPDFDQRWLARERISSVAAFPLICAGEMLGVLACYHRHVLPAEFVPALSAFAAIVAAALSDFQMAEQARAAREETEQQQRKLQTILDVLPVGVLLVEGHPGQVTLVNPAAHQIAGVVRPAGTLDAFHQATPLFHLDGRPYEVSERPLWRTLHSGERIHETLIYRRVDGTDVTLEVATAPYPGPRGGAVSTFRDVTEERRLKSELADRAGQLKALLDHLPVGVVYFDPRGVCRAANGPARRVLGRSRASITGVRADELFAHAEALREGLARCLEDRMPHVELSAAWPEALGSDGIRYLDWRFEPLPGSPGKLGGVLALIVDVTERKLVADQLQRAAEAAEQASRNKTQFLSAVSHDLRTPVNALSLQAEWLTQLVQRQENADPELVLLADDIRLASSNMIELVHDLLELSLFDSGVHEYHTTDFGLDEWLNATLSPLKVTARNKNLEFTWRVDRPGRTIRGDRVKLARVLVNLAGNAVKFTERGSVEVVAAVDPAGRFVLTVTDTGPGIPENQRSRIFDEFAQLRNPERDRTKGTGLGLAICRRLVEGAGGTLSVASSEGVGSRFTATYPSEYVPDLPARPAPAQADGEAASAPGRDLGPILLVEDDPYSRRSLARLLERSGYEVETAETGPAALEAVQRRMPGLILLDLMLPGLDGAEVLRRIRLQADRETLPVVVLSGDVLVGRTAELQTLDVNGILPKPVELADLQRVLRKWIGPAPAKTS
jgi:PAS domain S-box-containing protein